jgi:chromosome segregation ATPase
LRSSGDNGEMGEMPTPTKSNRSSKHKKGIDSILPSSHQSSNEEDDMRSRMAHLELKRLKNDLKIKASAEETLKTIIQDSSRQLATITAQAENLAQEKSGLLIRLKEFEMEKNKLENDLHKVNEEAKILQNYKRNHSENESSKEISHLKSELKSIAKERKKLKKSLADAVEMLNALQEHVLTAEKERKKMKKQLRSVVLNCSADSKPSETNHSDAEQSSHADQMETQTTILQLKSHIVGLDHEIRILIDRIDELEESKKTAKVPNNDSSKVDIHRLQKELVEAQNALIVAKGMLGEVTEVNKELLSDLRATEIEEEETMKELEILKHKLNEAQKELSNVNLAASSALKKFDGLMANSDVGGTGRNDSIIGLINRLERYSVALLDLNRTKEHAIEEKNLMILELLDKVKSRQ